MPGNAREMITTAERQHPVRIRIAVPPQGLGEQLGQITAWLDANCGAEGWVMMPSGTRGVLNDALAIYFLDATLASAFVARWCIGYRRRDGGGGVRVRSDSPQPPARAAMHRNALSRSRYVRSRSPPLRCQRDQARLRDPAASAYPEHRAELECHADRPECRWSATTPRPARAAWT